MQEISESEIYDFITKDGSSLEAIRKNTQQLRERLADESERRIHSLTRLDPDNQERHENESERIFEEKNRKIDRVLLQLAENASTKLPLHREAALKASDAITGSRKSANAISRFIKGFFETFIFFGICLVICILVLSALDYYAHTGMMANISGVANIPMVLAVIVLISIFIGVAKAADKESE